jgi:ABC-2 type transport system permease protein
MIVLVPQIFLVFMAFIGVVINLPFPRLDWLNEVQVAKQSASAMLSLFGAMAGIAGLGLL